MNRLNRIYNELTPRQHKKFDDKIKLIRKILEQRERQAQIIRAENIPRPTPPPPTEPRSGSKTSPPVGTGKTPPSEARSESGRRKGVQQLNPAFLRKVTPNITSLSNEEITNAKLIKAARINHDQDSDFARSYLEEQGIPLEVDKELTQPKGLVVHDNQGNAKVIYKGTNLQDLNDLKADLSIVTGNYKSNPEFVEAKNLYKNVMEKYTSSTPESIGFSLGGAKAIHVANEYNGKSTTYNSFITPSTDVRKGEHTLIRTTDDLPSLGVGSLERSDNIDIKNLASTNDSYNPIEVHKLDNFLSNETRGTGSNAFPTASSLGISAVGGTLGGIAAKAATEKLGIDKPFQSDESNKIYNEFVQGAGGSVGAITFAQGLGMGALGITSAPELALGGVSNILGQEVQEKTTKALGDTSGAKIAGASAGGAASGVAAGLGAIALGLAPETGGLSVVLGTAALGGSLGLGAESVSQGFEALTGSSSS